MQAGGQIISVVVPEGKYTGDTIRVAAPAPQPIMVNATMAPQAQTMMVQPQMQVGPPTQVYRGARYPQQLCCPYCNQVGPTRVSYVAGGGTWLICAGVCISFMIDFTC